ncbi:hypothetical protein CBR_g30209 [Chara braunii]|uniref:VWFA domain-containing protein n=1 Tax=Chara braunii TaxID=69332 RepID=A0A388LCC8_CHABU|nr:hypothetical protein CBR_g30209 [Chara braunii]|eukprot:GBG79946.1 hypothetical protein CBR_g30209 [Chara braunii]
MGIWQGEGDMERRRRMSMRRTTRIARTTRRSRRDGGGEEMDGGKRGRAGGGRVGGEDMDAEEGEDTRKGRRRGGMEDEEVRGGGGDKEDEEGQDEEDEQEEEEEEEETKRRREEETWRMREGEEEQDAKELARFTTDLESAIRDLIREYHDVFPPHFSYCGIPAMRGVEHSIQFVPDYRNVVDEYGKRSFPLDCAPYDPRLRPWFRQMYSPPKKVSILVHGPGRMSEPLKSMKNSETVVRKLQDVPGSQSNVGSYDEPQSSNENETDPYAFKNPENLEQANWETELDSLKGRTDDQSEPETGLDALKELLFTLRKTFYDGDSVSLTTESHLQFGNTGQNIRFRTSTFGEASVLRLQLDPSSPIGDFAEGVRAALDPLTRHSKEHLAVLLVFTQGPINVDAAASVIAEHNKRSLSITGRPVSVFLYGVDIQDEATFANMTKLAELCSIPRDAFSESLVWI